MPGEPLDPNGTSTAAATRRAATTPIRPWPSARPTPSSALGVVCDASDDVPARALDTELPETEILTGPANGPVGTSSETAVFTFTGTDNLTPALGLTFECRLDPPPDPVVVPEPDLEPPETPPDVDTPPEPENWGECSSPLTYQFLEPGDHFIEVRAIDHADNKDATPATGTTGPSIRAPRPTRASTRLAPDTRLAAAPAHPTRSHTAIFKFSGSDDITAGPNLDFICRGASHLHELPDDMTEMPDGTSYSAWASCTSPVVMSDLQPGAHWFQVAAVDASGKADLTTPATHRWWIQPPPPDEVVPETEMLSGPDLITVLTSATFTFAGTDNQTEAADMRYECRLDGAMTGSPSGPIEAWTPCTSPHTLTALAVGNRVLQVRAKDLAGNEDPTPASYVVDDRARSDPEAGLLRPEDHAEHHPQQQPDRLSRSRPDRRRQRDHDRPEREDHRRQGRRRRRS